MHNMIVEFTTKSQKQDLTDKAHTLESVGISGSLTIK
jgi:hypothetical protein